MLPALVYGVLKRGPRGRQDAGAFNKPYQILARIFSSPGHSNGARLLMSVSPSSQRSDTEMVWFRSSHVVFVSRVALLVAKESSNKVTDCQRMRLKTQVGNRFAQAKQS